MKNKIIFLIFLWCVCIILDLQFSFGFTGFFQLIVWTLLLSIVFVFIGIIQFLIKRKVFFIKVGVIGLLFCITELISVGTIIEWQREQTYKNAKIITEAVEKYYQDNKIYPSSLQEAVPKYLVEIPKTKMGWHGTDFNYSGFEGSDYGISFAYHAFIICQRYKNKDWYCID